MTTNQYQNDAIKFALPKTRNLTYMVLGLTSEAGEVAGKLKKVMRGDGTQRSVRDDLIDELGDVAWYLAGLCTQLKIPLEEVFARNLQKLESRQIRGKIKGSGDTR
jgi:NTP pyrophosphatase (non-canonical NTP hydrolase)